MQYNENYTGVITQTLKNGKISIRKYEKGLLQTASIMDGKQLISSKTYYYDKADNLVKIIEGSNEWTKSINEKEDRVFVKTFNGNEIITNIDKTKLFKKWYR